MGVLVGGAVWAWFFSGWQWPGGSDPQPMGCMQPRMAVNVAQHKITNLLKNFVLAHQFLLAFVYLLCGPGQLCFCQCGLEMPKVWPALVPLE